jgi:FMN phosphatase YigB (HAD superfamily)
VPFPEVRQELANLRRMGLKLGLATNAIQPMSMRDEELRHLGLLEFFEDGSRFSAADVGFLKPHPRIFEMALQSLEAEPEEAVFVGDSLAADIVGAQQVGMKAVLRTRVQGSLFARNNGDLEIIPDGKITSLTEIYPLLDTWFPEWKDGDDA